MTLVRRDSDGDSRVSLFDKSHRRTTSARDALLLEEGRTFNVARKSIDKFKITRELRQI